VKKQRRKIAFILAVNKQPCVEFQKGKGEKIWKN